MNDSTTTDPQTHYYLYTSLDGQERVFETFMGEALAVVDRAPLDPAARYIELDPPEDLRTAGREITEDEALRITGYYLEGRRAIEFALNTLGRVAPSDSLYLVAQAAEAMLTGLAPDVLPALNSNIFAADNRNRHALKQARDILKTIPPDDHCAEFGKATIAMVALFLERNATAS